MKKMFISLLAAGMVISMFAGCSSNNSDNEATNTTTPEATPTEAVATDNEATDTATAEIGITKMGLGHITSIASSSDMSKDADGKMVPAKGQVDTVMVAAAFDKDGKVVKVTIDNAQVKVNFKEDLQVDGDLTAENKTKVELADEYGMIKASSIQKEWYQQADALGQWMVGKSIDEIKGMKTKKVDESHPSVPDIAELTSSVTITVQDYVGALEEAYNNAIEVAAGAEKLGLGHNISIASSKGLGTKDGAEVLPVAQVDTVMIATTFDKDGKVVGTVIDNAQTKVNFDNTGKVTSDLNEQPKTKVELGDEYGMIKASSIQKEWYQQAEALAEWMAGKSVDEIKGMKTKAVNESHPSVPDVAELTASVTITVQDYIAALEESSVNAK
ncbi:hypothetical protein [Paenibacillus crassostreae]|uniref:FMN-binding protein n=1 Tax=Paenibacillus crassostreae TaxID=1763538 RepID=A0A167ASX9_9BACL|nr:hypothetical protein [Paenibacillus crassostreae]AOZ93702.1 hypothetical protein LPB68_16875 [Paenibacillus crassostreae]OAB71396.1 hypothetical protein PNBC_19745 [Paenibacillus crassostreae]